MGIKALHRVATTILLFAATDAANQVDGAIELRDAHVASGNVQCPHDGDRSRDRIDPLDFWHQGRGAFASENPDGSIRPHRGKIATRQRLPWHHLDFA